MNVSSELCHTSSPLKKTLSSIDGLFSGDRFRLLLLPASGDLSDVLHGHHGRPGRREVPGGHQTGGVPLRGGGRCQPTLETSHALHDTNHRLLRHLQLAKIFRAGKTDFLLHQSNNNYSCKVFEALVVAVAYCYLHSYPEVVGSHPARSYEIFSSFILSAFLSTRLLVYRLELGNQVGSTSCCLSHL